MKFMKALLVFLCLAVLLEAVSAGDGNKGGGKRGRMKKKKYRGKPNIIIFVVDDVSATQEGNHKHKYCMSRL